MADVNKTVSVIFEGDDRLSKIASNLQGKFGELDDAVSKISGPLAAVGDTVLKADAALAALAVGGMALAIKASGDFSKGFNEISTLTDANSKDIGKFREQVLNYAQGSSKSIDDINAAIYKAISAGVDYKKSLEVMGVAEKLSTAGKAELKDSLLLIVSSLNAYGEGTDKASKYADIFFQTVKQGQITLPELAEGLSRLTGIAAAAGIPIETLTSALVGITSSGLPVSQSIDGLKQAIANIIKPSSEAQEEAKSLGIQFDATALKTKGLDGVLRDVQRATRGNVEQMAKLFGSVEGLNVALTLGADKSGKFRDAIASMKNAAGATEAAYAKMAQNLDLVNQRLANAVKVTLIDIGDKLIGKYASLAGGLGDIFKGIKIAVDAGAFDPLFKVLDDAGGQLAQWIRGVAAALPEALGRLDFSGLISAINQLGRAFGAYFDGLDLTKPADLAQTLQTIVDIITGLIDVTVGMVDAFRPFYQQIRDFLIGLARSDQEAQKTLGTILALAMAVENAGLAIVGIILALDEFGASAQGVFNIVGGGAQIMWNGLQIILRSVATMIMVLVEGALGAIDKLTFGMIPGIDKARETVVAKMMQIRDTIIQDGFDARRGLDRMVDGFAQLGGQADDSTRRVDSLSRTIKAVPDQKESTVQVSTANSAAELDRIMTKMAGVPESKTLTVTTLTDGSKLIESVRKIDEAIPGTKQVDVKPVFDVTKVDLSKIENLSQYASQILDIKAKINLAEIDAATERIKTAFESVNTTIESTGDVITSMMKEWGRMTPGAQSDLWIFMWKEYDMREKAMELQRALAEAQIRLINAKSAAIGRGDALIKIDGTGLEPELQAFMWRILEKIQVRVNEEAGEFLLGLPARV